MTPRIARPSRPVAAWVAATALALLASACGGAGGPVTAVTQDTVVVYRHSVRTPEALAEGRWSPGDIETLLVRRLGANGWQRSEQLALSQGGREVPAARRGRWSVAVFEPANGRFLMHGLDEDRRMVWTDLADDPFRMPRGASREAEDAVLGLRCSVWRHADDEQEVEGCYNDAGVMLRQIVRMRPAVVTFEATEVRVEPIEPALLAVPPGWYRDPRQGRPPPPSPGSVLDGSADDLLRDCTGRFACLAEQARFRAAWPRAQAGEAEAMAEVARCLTENCEGAVRILPPVGCVFAAVIERRGGARRPEACWRDTTVPEQGFIIDTSKALEQRIAGR